MTETATTNPKKKTPLRERELWTSADMCTILGCGRTLFFELRRDQQVPRGHFLGGRELWRAREVTAWINAGMPNPGAWTWKPQALETLSQYRDRLADEVRDLEARRRELAQEAV